MCRKITSHLLHQLYSIFLGGIMATFVFLNHVTPRIFHGKLFLGKGHWNISSPKKRQIESSLIWLWEKSVATAKKKFLIIKSSVMLLGNLILITLCLFSNAWETWLIKSFWPPNQYSFYQMNTGKIYEFWCKTNKQKKNCNATRGQNTIFTLCS